jgi:hypothetical protein
LETEVDTADVLRERPDAVVLATGSRPGAKFASAIAPSELFERAYGGHVALINVRAAIVSDDGRGDWQTYSSAEVLADLGADVTVVTPSSTLGAALPLESRRPLALRLKTAGIRVLLGTRITAISENGATIEVPLGSHEVPADIIVYNQPRVADDRIAFELERAGVEVHRAGDCMAPGDIGRAIYEGHAIGRAL